MAHGQESSALQTPGAISATDSVENLSHNIDCFVRSGAVWSQGCELTLKSRPLAEPPLEYTSMDDYLLSYRPLMYEEVKEATISAWMEACKRGHMWKTSVLKLEGAGPLRGAIFSPTYMLTLHHIPGGNLDERSWSPMGHLLRPGSVVAISSTPPPHRPSRAWLAGRQDTTPNAAVRAHPHWVVGGLVKHLRTDHPLAGQQGTWTDEEITAEVVTVVLSPVCPFHSEKVSAAEMSPADTPCFQALLHLRSHSGPVYLTLVGSITTHMRECRAVQDMEQMPLRDVLLRPRSHLPNSLEDVDLVWPRELEGLGLVAALATQFDESQLGAIALAVSPLVHHWQGGRAPSPPHEAPANASIHATQPSPQPPPHPSIVLIQGPPGTGKTHTNVGILNVWHQVMAQRYFLALLKDMVGPTSLAKMRKRAKRHKTAHVLRRPLQDLATPDMPIPNTTQIGVSGPLDPPGVPSQQLKPRILVCAPSNAAVDEVMSRILTQGFMGGLHHRYYPFVVRVAGEGSVVRGPGRKCVLGLLADRYLMLDSATWSTAHSRASSRTQHLATVIAQLTRKLRAGVTGEGPAGLSRSTRPSSVLDQPPQQLQLPGGKRRQRELQEVKGAECSGGNGENQGSGTAQDDGVRKGDTSARSDWEERQALLQRLMSLLGRQSQEKLRLRCLELVKAVSQGLVIDPSSIEVIRDQLQAAFLEEADIVCTTLSTTGQKVFGDVQRGFDVVLVDEATQASELATLQALALGCRVCVMVGDPQQLPPTILSGTASHLQLGRSLFERLQLAGWPVKMLQVQYRMHPDICKFPSDYCYQGRLEDGPNIKAEVESLVSSPGPHLAPFLMLNMLGGREMRGEAGSLSNSNEVDLVVHLVGVLLSSRRGREAAEATGIEMQGVVAEGRSRPEALHRQDSVALTMNEMKIGVITPYRSQQSRLQQALRQRYGPGLFKHVVVATVDGFQGKQVDIAIMSCVRANGIGGSRTKSSRAGVGFLADVRRMNVALTRARRALWVIADCRTLRRCPAWAALVKSAGERRVLVDVGSDVDVCSTWQHRLFVR